MKPQQTKYPRPSKSWSSSTLSMARFNLLRAGREQSRKQRSGFPSDLVRECSGSIMRLPRSSVQPPRVISGRSENMRRWQKVPGATGQHGCLFSFDPGVYDQMQLPPTDCQKCFANLRETSNGKRCLGQPGERETERKTTTWLLVRLYGCTGASGSIVQRRVRRPATQGHRWPLGKYAAMAKGTWGDRAARMLILLRSRGI